MPDVYAAIGGNVDPDRYLNRALSLLEARFGALTASPAYRNAAVGFDGPDFINLVVKFASDLSLPELRVVLQEIEATCDRPPDAPKWAPRTMDIDVLLYGDLVSDAPGLAVPRPDLVRRAYMLKPMADIAPDVVHPTLGRTMRELWRDAGLDHHAMEQVTIPRSDRRPPPGSDP